MLKVFDDFPANNALKMVLYFFNIVFFLCTLVSKLYLKTYILSLITEMLSNLQSVVVVVVFFFQKKKYQTKLFLFIVSKFIFCSKNVFDQFSHRCICNGSDIY